MVPDDPASPVLTHRNLGVLSSSGLWVWGVPKGSHVVPFLGLVWFFGKGLSYTAQKGTTLGFLARVCILWAVASGI